MRAWSSLIEATQPFKMRWGTALAARPYLKPRDVFDLHWLSQQGSLHACTDHDLRARLAT
jgi:hypothetical protein